MTTFNGVRLRDTRIGDFPCLFEDLPLGAYWKVLHRQYDRPLNVRDYPEDRGWWGRDSAGFDGNLTGGVWGIFTPHGSYGMLSIHTVREEEAGTISVRPGDGSSNSILVGSPTESGESRWHGYIEHGVWSEI